GQIEREVQARCEGVPDVELDRGVTGPNGKLAILAATFRDEPVVMGESDSEIQRQSMGDVPGIGSVNAQIVIDVVWLQRIVPGRQLERHAVSEYQLVVAGGHRPINPAAAQVMVRIVEAGAEGVIAMEQFGLVPSQTALAVILRLAGNVSGVWRQPRLA